jgi:hypothetical protein
MLTRMANRMFLIIFLVLLMSIAAAILFATGNPNLAYLLGDFGPLAVFGAALLGVTFSPKRTFRIVSSDWLVNLLTRTPRSNP